MPPERTPADDVFAPTRGALGRPHVVALLALILLVGGAFRLYNLRISPPGLNQDEASNAWNAWSLLQTGKDQAGVEWPIFYARCLGENRSTLFLYWMMPFQAIGGLNVWTTRLPAAVAGILTLPLVYYVGARLFGRNVGVLTAAFLAISPWHIQQSRWGHEATIIPMLVAGTLAAMLWANLPLDDARDRRPRPLLAMLAGLIAGVSCYGYPAVRIFLPVFLGLAILANAHRWISAIRDRRGLAAAFGFAATALVVFAPLAYKHLTDSANIDSRFTETRLWNETDSTATKVKLVAQRYAAHFGPNFLFIHGDQHPIQSPPAGGQLPLCMLPLLLVGAVAGARRCGTSMGARLLLAGVIAYPVGDCFAEAASMHALRSLPGLIPLVLLAAAGAIVMIERLCLLSRQAAWCAGIAIALLALGQTALFAHRFYGVFNRNPKIYHLFQADLLEACEWLRSQQKLQSADLILIDTLALNQPYAVTLVGFDYDPRQWFRDEHDILRKGFWDQHNRYGKVHFAYEDHPPRFLDTLRNNNRRDRVIFIMRPNPELPEDKCIYRIVNPVGETSLGIYEFIL